MGSQAEARSPLINSRTDKVRGVQSIGSYGISSIGSTVRNGQRQGEFYKQGAMGMRSTSLEEIQKGAKAPQTIDATYDFQRFLSSYYHVLAGRRHFLVVSRCRLGGVDGQCRSR